MFALNMIFFLILLLACIVPYTASASLAFVSLAVPVLVFVNMLFFLYWLFKFNIRMLLSLSVLIYGYFALDTFVVFNSIEEVEDTSNTLSIMSFNSLGFRGKEDEWKSTAGDTIVKFIQRENPDIVCFQEFDYRKIRSHFFEEYPYKYVDFNFDVDEDKVIQAIYSKHKIINKEIIEFPESSNSAVYADVIVQKDTIRVYNLHLESLNIRPSNIKRERSDKLFVRLRNSFSKQQQQSTIVRSLINKSPYPLIVCGDFNNTQFSNSYFTIKGSLNDTFLKKGNGYGKTINFWKFPFRIDFILVDPVYEVLSHYNYEINLSDHEPIMATIKIGHE
ncbi:endonuclease/exonuclease/phosphatase family metal-dependent hydrolase [Maribacter sp. MAR_2009_72]|nr:endonuclease/exonuclease/phosphatase family metal-dependent hydrolase [Maribacter sp. MAR_2009_72]